MPLNQTHRLCLAVALAATLAATLAGTSNAAHAQPKPAARAARDNQPPESATSKRMLELARAGQVRQARSIGRQYIQLHPGSPRTGEHCMVLVAFAYADLLLDLKDESRTALGVFDRGCKQKSVRDEYRFEARKVLRVLDGEAITKVYPAAPVK